MKYLNRYRFILFFIFLLLLLFSIELILNYGIKKSRSNQIGKVNKILIDKIDPEIMIFGSSVGEVGVNSNIIRGITNAPVYNSSIDGTSYIQYKGLIDEFMSYSILNKNIFFIESYFTFQNPNQITNLERYIVHLNNYNIYNTLFAIQPDLVWKSRYIPFYKFIPITNTFYKNSLFGIYNHFLKNNQNDTLNGYTPVNRNWVDDENFNNIYKIEINSKIVEKYINTIKSLQNKNRKVYIIFPPVYIEKASKFINFNSLIKQFQFIQKETGCIFLNFTQNIMCNDKKYFYNINHMNSLGSNLFSSILADSIIRINKNKL